MDEVFKIREQLGEPVDRRGPDHGGRIGDGEVPSVDLARVLNLREALSQAEEVDAARAMVNLGRELERSAFGLDEAEQLFRAALEKRRVKKDLPLANALSLLASLLTKRVVHRICDDDDDQ